MKKKSRRMRRRSNTPYIQCKHRNTYAEQNSGENHRVESIFLRNAGAGRDSFKLLPSICMCVCVCVGQLCKILNTLSDDLIIGRIRSLTLVTRTLPQPFCFCFCFGCKLDNELKHILRFFSFLTFCGAFYNISNNEIISRFFIFKLIFNTFFSILSIEKLDFFSTFLYFFFRKANLLIYFALPKS